MGTHYYTLTSKLYPPHTKAKFLDKIQTKVLTVFLFSVHSHSFALRFLFLPHAISYVFIQNSRNLSHISTVQLLDTLKEEGGKHDRTPYPLPYDLRNPYRNIKSRTLKIRPRNFSEIVCSRIWLQNTLFTNKFSPQHHLP